MLRAQRILSHFTAEQQTDENAATFQKLETSASQRPQAPPRASNAKKELRPSDFTFFKPLQTRWLDNDMYGHANNTVYYTWFDLILNSFLMEQAGMDMLKGDVIGVVAASSCEYFSSCGFPSALVVALRVVNVGKTSAKYELAIFPTLSDPGASLHSSGSETSTAAVSASSAASSAATASVMAAAAAAAAASPKANTAAAAAAVSAAASAACAQLAAPDAAPHAVSQFVHVFVDRDHRKAVPMPPSFRAALERFSAKPQPK